MYEGQVHTYLPGTSPCYRCIFPVKPPEGYFPKDFGLLSTVPGVIGVIQANEILKIITGVGNTISDGILIFNALKSEFVRLRIEKDPTCICSEH